MKKTPIKPFTTDGCSGGMTWFWKTFLGKNPPWNEGCVEHDKYYWRGGTFEERKKADIKLLIYVIEKGYPKTAFFMWMLIRIGGSPYLPFSWRWGYGYNWPHGYEKEPSLFDKKN